MMTTLVFVLIACRLLYWILLFSRLAMKKAVYNEQQVPVSIIVCVKNNIRGIQQLLPIILKQNHQQFECIIVDDFSTDGLQNYLHQIADERVKWHSCTQDIPGKKKALSEGIALAKYDWILLTDADCVPASLDWIRWMLASATERTDLVLGYGAVRNEGSFMSLMVMYETAYIAMQYLSYAMRGKAYMGVGRNLMFRKRSFESKKVYENNMDLASGDDDFLVQALAKKDNVAICLHPNAFTYTSAPVDFTSYRKQKSRHVTTSVRYAREIQWALGFFGFCHIAIYFLMALNLVFMWFPLGVAGGALLLMWGIMLVIQLPIYVKLKALPSLSWLPVADFFFAMFYLLLLPDTIKRDTTKWS